MNPTDSRNGTAAAPKKRASKSDRKPARRRVRVAEGIYRDRHGLAATVKVNGVQREIRFPSGTPLKAIRARRDELRASLRTLPSGERHTLAYDADRYLQQISGELVSIADRRYYVRQWAARFGHLRTLALSQHTAALNDQLRQWRETLSVSACNHRRDALTNLVKVLYGRRAAADLVDLVRFKRPPPRPRWLDRAHIAEVLAHLTPGSKTVVRLRLMHWTGMRPSQMGRLRPEDFRLDEPTPFVAVPRGKGGRLAAVPLVGEGLDAARDFMALRAYGRWSCPSANRALARAARSAGRPPFTVYQIRHSFATGLRRTGSDVADIQDMYGHTDPETTMIYAPPQLQKHAAAIERLQRADRAPAPVRRPIRLAETAGRVDGTPASR
ncbi:MAG: phage integrase family protein [Acidobacteria bacterium]|nr:phage integrase family protein [Acidobacteriota bacterium]